jgi:hypothetical protein
MPCGSRIDELGGDVGGAVINDDPGLRADGLGKDGVNGLVKMRALIPHGRDDDVAGRQMVEG